MPGACPRPVLQANTSSSDIVACCGGEEFAIVCTESQPAEAVGLAERIRERAGRNRVIAPMVG